MRRKDFILMALAIAGVAGWLIFRGPDGGSEQKGILKERLRAAESATQTLDAERAAGRERLRLAGIKADEQRALSQRAAAALPLYRQRREEAERKRKQERFEIVPASRTVSGMTREGRADGTERTAADNAALLRRLNALLH